MKRFVSTSFFFVAADAYSRTLCEFLSVASVSGFLPVNKMKITSFSDCLEQLIPLVEIEPMKMLLDAN